MDELINNCLTIAPMLDNLTVPSHHVAVRFCRRKNHKMPLARLILRLRYSMQKIISGGRYLGRESVQDSCVLSANPNNVHRPIFCRIKRCPLIITRDYTMPQDNSAQQNHALSSTEIIRHNDEQPQTVRGV